MRPGGGTSTEAALGAVTAVVLATSASALLDPDGGAGLLPLCLACAALAASTRGLWPGALATTLATAVLSWPLLRSGDPAPPDVARVALVAAVGLGSSGLHQQLRREQALREEALALERRLAAERVAAVLAERERTRQSLAEALRVRDEFLSVATHELRTPLSALMLALQLLRRRAERGRVATGDELASAMDGPLAQAQKLSRMIDALLDVSRMRNHHVRLDVQVIDLRATAAEVVERLQAEAREAGASLTLAPGPAVIAYLDPLRMEQVVTNLITNALKYGQGSPVTVGVDGTDSHVRLTVADRGIGIAAEDHARIFDRFQRTTERHAAQSLGLGLYIVKEIVEAHGGTVVVASAPGRGSTFTVTLPARRIAGRPDEVGDGERTKGSRSDTEA